MNHQFTAIASLCVCPALYGIMGLAEALRLDRLDVSMSLFDSLVTIVRRSVAVSGLSLELKRYRAHGTTQRIF
jgi:hypothetical protein